MLGGACGTTFCICSTMTYLFYHDHLDVICLCSRTATLYFAMDLQSTPLTKAATGLQIIALVWFVILYLQGCQTGLRHMGKQCGATCQITARSSLLI